MYTLMTESTQALYRFMEQHSEIGQVMPKVLYPDGRLQPFVNYFLLLKR